MPTAEKQASVLPSPAKNVSVRTFAKPSPPSSRATATSSPNAT